MNEAPSLFKQAKSIDPDMIMDFFQGGIKPVRVSGWLRYSSCVKCGPSSKNSVKFSYKDGFFSCFSCGEKGDIINAAQHYYNCSEKEAAQKLVEEFGSGFAEAKPRPTRKELDDEDKEKHDAFARILNGIQGIDLGQFPTPIIRYLTVNRAIPYDIIRKAHSKGIIIGLPTEPFKLQHLLETRFSRSDLAKSHLWKEGAKMAGVVYRPLLFPLPGGTSAEFRTISEPKAGSPKAIRYGKTTQPWFWQGEDEAASTYIVEGVLDMLSLPALGAKGNIIGLPGVNSWVNKDQEWFSSLIGKKVIVCFDNDPEHQGLIPNPGQHWAEKLCTALANMGVIVENKVLPVGIDPNKLLQIRANKKMAA